MYTITQPALVQDNETIRPAKCDGIRAHRSDGEAVLYDEQSKTTYHLNETAFLLWDACDGTRTLGDLASMLSDRYEVAEAIGQDDVDQIAAFLAKVKLVTAEVPSGSYLD